jgi:hypothetical protein
MRRLTAVLIAALLSGCGRSGGASGNSPPSSCSGHIDTGDHTGDFGCYAAARFYTKGSWTGNSLIQALNSGSEKTQVRPAGVTDLGIRVEIAGEPLAGVYDGHSMPETKAYVDFDDGRVFDKIVAMKLTLERIRFHGQEASPSIASRVFAIEGRVTFTVADDAGSQVSVSASFGSSNGSSAQSISGAVAASPGVTVTASSRGLAVASALTDASGKYTLSGLADGSYTLVASKTGYAFVPPSRDATVAGGDLSGLDFSGDIVTYSICGTVAGGAGATMSAIWNGAAAATETADASGSYCLAGLVSGLYTVTPSMAGYTFSPANRDVAVSGADVAGKNFTAYLIKYAISGTVTGAPYATVVLAAEGVDVESTTTDAFGYYTFADLPVGSYAVTPNADGFAFKPSRRDVTLSGMGVADQDFAVGQWRWQNPLPQGNTLNGIWGSRADDVWAVGNGGTILHWGGSAWTAVPSGSTAHLRAAWGSSSSDVWAVGSAGTTLHWDGSAWAKVASGSTVQLNGLWGSGRDDVWAVGAGGTILRWRGARWEDAGKNGGPSNVVTKDLNGVWGNGLDDVWAVGQFDQTVDPASRHRTMLHWDGSAWTNLDPESGYGNSRPDLTCVWGNGPGDVWMGELSSDMNGSLRHWVGAGWAVVNPVFGVSAGAYRGVWGTGPDDVWAVGDGGQILQIFLIPGYFQTSRRVPSDTTNGLCGVWGSAANDVWAVGEAGTIVHWDGTAWTSASSGGAVVLSGVHGTGADDAWAVGRDGAALHWNGSTWTPVSTATTVTLNDVWTAKVDGVDDVWAVGPYGVILHGRGAQWTLMTGGASSLTAVWGSGPYDIWAAGAAGTILHGNGVGWEAVSSKTASALNGVWGSGPFDVWAVGAEGTILHWDGAGWTLVESGTTQSLHGVWGSGASDVWAVGEAGIILHWDGAGWSGVSSGIANDLARVWGSWASDAWAVGSEGVVLRWDGTSWSAVTSGTRNTLNAVWGSGPSDVHVVGDIGTILGWQ